MFIYLFVFSSCGIPCAEPQHPLCYGNISSSPFISIPLEQHFISCEDPFGIYY